MPLLEGEGEEKEGYCGWFRVSVRRKGGREGRGDYIENSEDGA